LVQLPNQRILIAFQIIQLQTLLPEIRPQGIDLVLQLSDVPQREIVPLLEIRISMGLNKPSCTFS
jgi:hypothetical protein